MGKTYRWLWMFCSASPAQFTYKGPQENGVQLHSLRINRKGGDADIAAQTRSD